MPERQLGRQQNVHKAAEAPNIAAEAILFSFHHFWRHIARGANLELGSAFSRLELDGAAKVTDVKLRFFLVAINKYVSALYVPMNYVAVMQGLEAACYLTHDNLNFGLNKRLFAKKLTLFSCDVFFEVTASHIASHAEVEIVILEGLKEPHYVRAGFADFFHNLKLGKHLVIGIIGFSNLLFVNYLDGNFDFCVFVLS